jgi:hypothetical protein
LPSTKADQTSSFTLDDGSQVRISGDVKITFYRVTTNEYRVCASSLKGRGNT